MADILRSRSVRRAVWRAPRIPNCVARKPRGQVPAGHLQVSRGGAPVHYRPEVDPSVAIVSIEALARALFAGIDRFFVDLFKDKTRGALADQRFPALTSRSVPVVRTSGLFRGYAARFGAPTSNTLEVCNLARNATPNGVRRKPSCMAPGAPSRTSRYPSSFSRAAAFVRAEFAVMTAYWA
jgi:hypothetical protein